VIGGLVLLSVITPVWGDEGQETKEQFAEGPVVKAEVESCSG
jgi:hypothetical protein